MILAANFKKMFTKLSDGQVINDGTQFAKYQIVLLNVYMQHIIEKNQIHTLIENYLYQIALKCVLSLPIHSIMALTEPRARGDNLNRDKHFKVYDLRGAVNVTLM